MDWSGGPQVPKGSGKLPLERESRGKDGAGKATETLHLSLIFYLIFTFIFVLRFKANVAKCQYSLFPG